MSDAEEMGAFILRSSDDYSRKKGIVEDEYRSVSPRHVVSAITFSASAEETVR